MEEEFDLSLSPVRKSAPKQGRRAGGPGGGVEDVQDKLMGSPLKSRPMSGDFLDAGPVRPETSGPPRRAGGWADENARAKTAKSERYIQDSKTHLV